MGDVVNLNQYRKQRSRAVSQKRASENRVRFGRTRSEKELARARADKAARDLEQKKLD